MRDLIYAVCMALYKCVNYRDNISCEAIGMNTCSENGVNKI